MTDVAVRISHPRLHRQMLALMVEAILRGDYLPGELLPREIDLVDKFGVSRGVVREAIRGLEERDLVSVRHGHGAIVRDASDWNILADDILPTLLLGPASVEVLREVIEARRILEVEAAALAAQRATPADIERIRIAVGAMEELGSPTSPRTARDEFLEADIAFHETVIAATGNRALRRIVAPIHHSLLEARRPLARPEYRKTRAVPEHAAILAAIERHDADAARKAMQTVFGTITDYLSEYADSTRIPSLQGENA
jgi:GntR family transcriptional repressor for pyruvate dehydrogenase complex